MNYYPHHIGDYTKDTAHLSVLEDGAYRRLLDLYYSTERPLPLDRAVLYRLARAREKSEREAIDIVLSEFFQERSDGWHQERCDAEIAKMQEKSGKAKASAAIRWQSGRNPNASDSHTPSHSERISERMTPSTTDGDPKAMLPITKNQEPITNNQEPKKPKAVAFAPPGWVDVEKWNSWVAIRPAKARTPASLKAAVEKLEKFRADGFDGNEAIATSLANGWQGLFCPDKPASSTQSLSQFMAERDSKRAPN